MWLPLGPISLMHGWAPVMIQVLAAAVLLLAVGWRSRRWRLLWVPVSAVIGLAAAAGTYCYVQWSAVGHRAPVWLWIWITLAGLAVAVLVFGWRNTSWWRRGVSVLAVPLCVLCVALAVNVWTGYLPTVQSAWYQLTGRPVSGQIDEATVAAMRAQGAKPQRGTIVAVTIPDDASRFAHRQEYVYLPPTWYSNPQPQLPAVMMVGAEFGTPADWLKSGDARKTIDDFASQHGGNAPVLVFADVGGSFSNDTECVNGLRGNAADHLTKDIVPYVISHFGVSADAANWGVVGYSMGGTCAVDLAVRYPDLFSTFVDIDGDLFPNAGFKAQTIYRIFGGDEQAWAAFDPATVMSQHGPYAGLAGLFAHTTDFPTEYKGGATGVGAPVKVPSNPQDVTAAAHYLCAVASSYGIECSVVAESGKHDWQLGSKVFADVLPWLAGRLGTPGAARVALPGAGSRG